MSKGELSLCCVYAGGRAFAVDTRHVCEVLAHRPVQPVPLAPGFVAGMVPYRGDVLTAVSLRAVLGLEGAPGDGPVVVIDGGGKEKDPERCFGLVVDETGGVSRFAAESVLPVPAALDARSRAVFDGVLQTADGLMMRLDVSRLWPVRLRDSGLFHREERVTECEL